VQGRPVDLLGAGRAGLAWPGGAWVQGRRRVGGVIFAESREVALEAGVAWPGLSGARREGEWAGRGAGDWSRVGKNEILVNGRGAAGGPFSLGGAFSQGLFQGPAACCGLLWPAV